MNLANANVTRTVDGGPYRAKSVIFSSERYKPEPESAAGTNAGDFDTELAKAVETVKVAGIVEDPDPFIQVYDPSHPDADENGMVSFPNVNTMEQMVDVMNASRAYEANATVLETAKNMAMKALELAR
jgi:flagellar basal-body rod protein FlgC